MNKKIIVWLGILFVVTSIGITAWNYLQKKQETKDKYKSYVPAKAVIKDVIPLRLTRQGVQQARYRLSFVDTNGKTYTQSNCVLSSNYNKSDTVTIYYNPVNPNDDVVVNPE